MEYIFQPLIFQGHSVVSGEYQQAEIDNFSSQERFGVLCHMERSRA